MLDYARLNATQGPWIEATLPVLEQGHRESAVLSAGYFDEFRAVEGPQPARSRARVSDGGAADRAARSSRVRVSTPDFDTDQAIGALIVTGPARVMNLTKRGTAEPMDQAFISVAGATTRIALDGGRDLLKTAVELDKQAIGYCRVTKPNPCWFCALLASAGAVYKSTRSFDTSNSKRTGDGPAKVHDNCQCTLEPIYDEDAALPGRAAEWRKMWEEIAVDLGGHEADLAFRRAYERSIKLDPMQPETETAESAPDLGEYLEAERLFLDEQTQSYLAAEEEYNADVESWLAAEEEYEASRPVSKQTRALIEQSRAHLPQGKDGWDGFQTLSKDANGAFVPSRRLKSHLDTVTTVGRAIRQHIDRRIDADPELVELRAARDAAEAERIEHLKASRYLEVFRSEDRRRVANKKVAERESAAILEALADVRNFGGHAQTVRTLTDDDRVKLRALGHQDVDSVDIDATTLLREAERFYPTEWLQAADARGPIGLGYVERGFFLQKHSSTLPYDSITVAPRGAVAYAGGAHSDDATETMIHELGHRMEMAVPGLTQLEFALARTRATHNGVLEDLTEMTPGEVAYEDQWVKAYAGRSYAEGTPRPDLVAHEVFQTGTQDLYGRSIAVYGDAELQEFMMGVLALL